MTDSQNSDKLNLIWPFSIIKGLVSKIAEFLKAVNFYVGFAKKKKILSKIIDIFVFIVGIFIFVFNISILKIDIQMILLNNFQK